MRCRAEEVAGLEDSMPFPDHFLAVCATIEANRGDAPN